jgi:hypothetical protein
MLAHFSFFVRRRMALALFGSSLALLAGCSDETFDTARQIGPNPKLPNIQQYLFPPMHLASIVGWKAGETPKVPQGADSDVIRPGIPT